MAGSGREFRAGVIAELSENSGALCEKGKQCMSSVSLPLSAGMRAILERWRKDLVLALGDVYPPSTVEQWSSADFTNAGGVCRIITQLDSMLAADDAEHVAALSSGGSVSSVSTREVDSGTQVGVERRTPGGSLLRRSGQEHGAGDGVPNRNRAAASLFRETILASKKRAEAKSKRGRRYRRRRR